MHLKRDMGSASTDTTANNVATKRTIDVFIVAEDFFLFVQCWLRKTIKERVGG